MAFKFKHIIACDQCHNEIGVLARSQEEANAIATGKGWQVARRIRANGKLDSYIHACTYHPVPIKDECEKLVSLRSNAGSNPRA